MTYTSIKQEITLNDNVLKGILVAGAATCAFNSLAIVSTPIAASCIIAGMAAVVLMGFQKKLQSGNAPTCERGEQILKRFCDAAGIDPLVYVQDSEPSSVTQLLKNTVTVDTEVIQKQSVSQTAVMIANAVGHAVNGLTARAFTRMSLLSTLATVPAAGFVAGAQGMVQSGLSLVGLYVLHNILARHEEFGADRIAARLCGKGAVLGWLEGDAREHATRLSWRQEKLAQLEAAGRPMLRDVFALFHDHPTPRERAAAIKAMPDFTPACAQIEMMFGKTSTEVRHPFMQHNV